jgi:hypothetical protein
MHSSGIIYVIGGNAALDMASHSLWLLQLCGDGWPGAIKFFVGSPRFSGRPPRFLVAALRFLAMDSQFFGKRLNAPCYRFFGWGYQKFGNPLESPKFFIESSRFSGTGLNVPRFFVIGHISCNRYLIFREGITHNLASQTIPIFFGTSPTFFGEQSHHVIHIFFGRDE